VTTATPIDANSVTLGKVGSNFLNGNLDDIKFYNYIRSNAEIVSDMNASHPAPGSPVGSAYIRYAFDEGYGGTANNTGSGGTSLNGTITAGAWNNIGKFGKALTFTASSSVTATITDPAYTNSISVWVYPTTSAASKTLISNLTTDGSSRPVYGGCTGAALPLSTWTHVLAVSSGSGSCAIYQNGVQTSTGGTGVTFGTSLNLGASSYIGSLDEFKFYTSALTPDQAKAEFNQGQAQVMGHASPGGGYCPPGDDSATCAPVAEYFLNEKSGVTANNTQGGDYPGTLQNSPARNHQAKCHSGSCLEFNGSTQYVDIGTGPTSVKSMEFWVKPTTTAEYFMNLTDNSDYIWSNSGTLTATGLDSPIIYVNGVRSTVINSGIWQHVVVVTDTAENANNLDLGRTQDSNYLEGSLDQIRLYNHGLSPAQVSWHYNQGAPQILYHFDECTGTTLQDTAPRADKSLTGTSATITPNTGRTAGSCESGVSTEMWNGGTTGKYSASLDFDGAGDYAATTNVALLAPVAVTYSNLSWGGWVKPATSPTSDTLLHKNNEFKLTTDGSGLPQCEIYSGSWQTALTGTTALPTSSWSHILCTYDGVNLKLYVNGTEVKRLAETDALTSSSATALNLARDAASSGYFDGQLDEVKIWSYDLTKEQVQLDYNQGSAAKL
jgi:hypothetical protein